MPHPLCAFFLQEDASRYAGLLGPTPLTTGPVGTSQELAAAEKVRITHTCGCFMSLESGVDEASLYLGSGGTKFFWMLSSNSVETWKS